MSYSLDAITPLSVATCQRVFKNFTALYILSSFSLMVVMATVSKQSGRVYMIEV